jgi:2-dehydrotetronate isomerase
MIRFSANLGFLWADRPLPDAIHAAGQAGFDAVECHWPYETPADDVRAALTETGLPMLGLNTRRGDASADEFGLSALPGREVEAQAAIDEALEYARAVGAQAVHVMAGMAQGPDAQACFVRNLQIAAHKASASDTALLIEPLNPFDVPGYALSTTAQAVDIMRAVGAPNLKLMFDCYHVGRSEGDVIARFHTLLPLIGHVQFASIPKRGRPDQGDLNYREVFDTIAATGWARPLGAEYLPYGATEDSLGWMQALR